MRLVTCFKHIALTSEEVCKLECSFETVGVAIRVSPDYQAPATRPGDTHRLERYPGLFREVGKEFEQKIVISVQIWNGGKFDGFHVHLTSISLNTEMSSFIFSRMPGLKRIPPASMPSMTAPMTGGTL